MRLQRCAIDAGQAAVKRAEHAISWHSTGVLQNGHGHAVTSWNGDIRAVVIVEQFPRFAVGVQLGSDGPTVAAPW